MKNKIRLIMATIILSLLVVSGCKIINTTGNMTVMVAHIEERLNVLDKEYDKSFERYDVVALEDCVEKLNELLNRTVDERDKFVEDSKQYNMYNELVKVIKYRTELVECTIIRLEKPLEFESNKDVLETQINNYIDSINIHEKNYIKYRDELNLKTDKLNLDKYKVIKTDSEENDEETNIAYVATRYLEDKEENTKVVMASVLNVRNGAGMDQEIIGKLIRGTEVEVIKPADDEWSIIKYTPLE